MENEEDLYALLGVPVTATTGEISKAYRRKALRVHPDKVGPDNETAADEFLRLTRAVDVLTDATKRQAYDARHKSKVAEKERVEKLDAKRKRAKEDLERRESAAFKKPKESSGVSDEELKRLRQEGLRRLAEMQKADEEERAAAAAVNTTSSNSDLDHALSLKWNAAADDWNDQTIRDLFTPFGEIDILSVKKKGRALLVFKNAVDADRIHRKKESFKKFTISWMVPRTEKIEKEPQTSGSVEVKDGTSGFSFNVGGGSSSLNYLESDTLRRMKEKDRVKVESMTHR